MFRTPASLGPIPALVRTALQIGLLVVMATVSAGCAKRVPLPDVPLTPAGEKASGLRMLVVTRKPVSEETGRQYETEQWFKELEARFREAMLSAGFRVVAKAPFDVKATLVADRIEIAVDAVKAFTNLRVKLEASGKSAELIDEVKYHISENAELGYGGDDWMPRPGSDAFFARKIANKIINSSRVIAFSENAPRGDGGAETRGATARGAKGALSQGAPQRNAYALIVGIEKYRDVEAKATGARADAEGFAALAKRTLGAPEENIRLALGNHATKVDIEKHIDWLVANVPDKGRIYFYFSGHGAPDASKGTPYLLPYDGDPSALDRTALVLAQVLDALNRSKAADTVAFIDACFSGSGGRSVLPKGARPLVRVKKSRKVARVALFSAVSDAQISGPSADGKSGLFTHYLMRGLGNAAADVDGDGQVTLDELSTWVTPRVEREARKQNRKQKPNLTAPSGGTSAAVVIAHGLETSD